MENIYKVKYKILAGIKHNTILLGGILLIASCAMLPSKDKHYAGANEKNVYRLRPSPISGSTYLYDITNETEVKLEVDDKKIKNTNKTEVGIKYAVRSDSAGTLLLDMHYNKIHLYSKNGDKETDSDASSADTAIDQVARMLAILRSTNILASIAPTGEVKVIKGYREMSDRILATFNPSDAIGREAAQKQLDQVVGDGMVKKNMAQMFRMFPDSAIHIGDKWRLDSKEADQFNVKLATIYTLNDVNDGVALISSAGDVTSDGSSANSQNGLGNATVNLKGKQHGNYEMDAASGMLLSGKISIDIEGIVQTMGREIPISIHTSVEIKGTKFD